jgi:integrase
MASIRITSSGYFQLCVRNKLLPKTFWATFDTFEEADRYGKHLDSMLAKGIVPAAIQEAVKRQRVTWSICRCIAEYLRAESVPVSEIKLLDTLRNKLNGVTTAQLSYGWTEAWIRTMKREDNLSPSTIRHRHGALARCLDWIIRKHPEILSQNPLRLIKRGFATYTAEDVRYVVEKGESPKVDQARNRRLEAHEEKAILDAIGQAESEHVFFILALESAMRMRECYTLNTEQIGFAKKTIHLERTKNGDGRQVPLSSTALAILEAYISRHQAEISERAGRLFPFWCGDLSVYALDATTAELSATYRGIFKRAGIENLRFHDLRHEATCRLYEKTTLSDVLIARVTGHRSLRMLQRYASLRGSDLADRLW